MNGPHTHHPYLRCPLMDKKACRRGGGLDYRSSEVRASRLGLIREVIDRYDIDALELDWLRAPSCARREDTAVMTAWFGEIREVVDVKALANSGVQRFCGCSSSMSTAGLRAHASARASESAR